MTALIKALLAALLAAPANAAESKLRPESELVTGCYGFPETSFSRENCVKHTYGASPHVPLGVGDAVTDFTLPTVGGASANLKALLESRPVLLLWGMCPAFQGMGDGGDNEKWSECGYRDEYELVEAYKHAVTFVHLVGPEPHPVSPDANFDSGKQLMNYWSTVAQPKTWAERMVLAERVSLHAAHPDALLLVDTLRDAPDGRKRDQPVWCTLGHGARTALLVDQSGLLVYAQDWFHKSTMADAIDELLAKR